MNKKLEMIWWIALSIAEVSIVAFWIANFNGYTNFAGISITTAGIFSTIALTAKALKALREHNCAY